MTTSPTGNERGFTLVELALVTLVITILVAATAPRLHHTAQRLRIERAAAEAAHLFRAAHEDAVAGAQPIVWRWEDEVRRARVRTADDGPVVFESGPVPDAIAVRLAQGGEPVACACVRFFPDGTSDGGRLTLSGPEGAYDVSVDAATSQVAIAAGPAAH